MSFSRLCFLSNWSISSKLLNSYVLNCLQYSLIALLISVGSLVRFPLLSWILIIFAFPLVYLVYLDRGLSILLISFKESQLFVSLFFFKDLF